jgi:hypothetical protein
VTAVQTSSVSDVASASEFLAVWERTDPSRRVFVSFTRQDLPQARRVAAALRKAGYIPFTYLNETTGRIRYGADIVGRLFREAPHHLVIDTMNARRSRGVWLEARVAKITAGGEELYVQSRQGASSTATGRAGRPPLTRGEGIDTPTAPPETPRYFGPQMPVGALRQDPRIFDRAGGIMFGRPARLTGAAANLQITGVIYDRTAANGSRLLLETRDGLRYVVAQVTDAVLLPTVQFVADARPVIVNAQTPSACTPGPGDLRIVELHPAFVDTSIGAALIRADFLIWPALLAHESDALGRPFPAEQLTPAGRQALHQLRQLPLSFAARQVSNINDALTPAQVSVSGGQISLTGLPRLEVLTSSIENGRDGVRLETEVSRVLTANQWSLFRAADSDAYLTTIQVYRVAGLLNYLKESHAAAWTRFAANVPQPSRRSTTPSVICGSCTADDLFSWIASCNAR